MWDKNGIAGALLMGALFAVTAWLLMTAAGG